MTSDKGEHAGSQKTEDGAPAGMTIGPTLPDGRRSLILVSDNNFATSQFTQFLMFALS